MVTSSSTQNDSLASSQSGSISGTKFNDLNSNGVRDTGEPGLANFQIQLINSSGNVISTQTTNASGSYQFLNLANSPYVVREVNQSGFEQTAPTFSKTTTPSTNNFQSPVDITGVDAVDFDEFLEIDYDGESPESIERTPTNFELVYEEGNNNLVTLDEENFEVDNFHFHSESEHTVNGENSDLEMHIVNENESGGLTVLGILIEEGDFNEELAPVFDAVQSQLDNNGELSENSEFGEEIDLEEVLPENSGWFYNGSLTTPNFSEGVNWFVFEERIELSSEQIETFRDFLGSIELDSNNRPVQPLNGRQFNELNHQVTISNNNKSIANLNFGNTANGGDDDLTGVANSEAVVGGNATDGISGDNSTLENGDGANTLDGDSALNLSSGSEQVGLSEEAMLESLAILQNEAADETLVAANETF